MLQLLFQWCTTVTLPSQASQLCAADCPQPCSTRFEAALTSTAGMQIGIIIAQLINYGTVEIYEYGWRISLAIAAVPAFMILAGGIFLPETPSSLISRNRFDEGRKVRRSCWTL